MRSLTLATLLFLASFGTVHAGGHGPVTAVIQHPVADYDTWRQVYDALLPKREAAGMLSARVLQAPDDPNTIILIQEFETLEGAQALFSSPDLKAAMQSAGVTAPPVISIGVPVQ